MQTYDAITGHRLRLLERRTNGGAVFEDLDASMPTRISGFPLLSDRPPCQQSLSRRKNAWPLKRLVPAC